MLSRKSNKKTGLPCVLWGDEDVQVVWRGLPEAVTFEMRME